MKLRVALLMKRRSAGSILISYTFSSSEFLEVESFASAAVFAVADASSLQSCKESLGSAVVGYAVVQPNDMSSIPIVDM